MLYNFSVVQNLNETNIKYN